MVGRLHAPDRFVRCDRHLSKPQCRSVFLSFCLSVCRLQLSRLVGWLVVLLLLLLLSLLDVEGGWWRSGYTLLCLIMLMLQLTHHANHTVDGSHTSHVILVVHTYHTHAIHATAYSSC